MSILIKGINVHRGRCYECPCLDREYGDCNALKKDVHYVTKEDCPLIELPDHGDLIDRDEQIERAWRLKLDTRELIAEMLNSAPVVIPAERSEE